MAVRQLVLERVRWKARSSVQVSSSLTLASQMRSQINIAHHDSSEGEKVSGQPIICTPTDAFKCFMCSGMDVLAVGNYLLYKEQQDEELKENYAEQYQLD